MKTILAHRGITYNHPDNTVKSLTEIFNYTSNTIKLGVELDINMSVDGQIFIYHDQHINNIQLNSLTYNQILKLNKDIPLLTTILHLFNNSIYILDIEIKNYPPDTVRYTQLLFNIIKSYNVNYFFSSFDQFICNLCNNNNLLCYKLSDIDEEPGDIVYYTQNTTTAKGVYTIFNNDWRDEYIHSIKDVDILITDDVDKIIEIIVKN